MATVAKRGKALYDYKGNAEQRQLTFNKGDSILITNQFENGWWAGEFNGTLGYFPASYVQIEEGGAAQPPASPKGQPPKPAPKPTPVKLPPAPAEGKAAPPASPKGKPPVAARDGPPAPARDPAPTPGAGKQPPPAVAKREPQPVAPEPIASIKRTSMAAAQTVSNVPPPTTPKPQPTSPKPQPAPPGAANRPPVAAKPQPATPQKPTPRGGDVSQSDLNELDALITQLEADAREIGKLLLK